VAKGFEQIHGIDCDETFSLVMMLKFVQILLAIAAYFDDEIWQMDVEMAFLNRNVVSSGLSYDTMASSLTTVGGHKMQIFIANIPRFHSRYIR
jgi:hypothetical protein